jgi:hypothetical protein
VEENFKRKLNYKKVEKVKIQNQISSLKQEKNSCSKPDWLEETDRVASTQHRGRPQLGPSVVNANQLVKLS